jgi:sarcosine oxidase, subunit beta|tara:strand:+ start:893 stop:2077 length:1185 start_codon:yes stop_codon:yes gene_type:complete
VSNWDAIVIGAGVIGTSVAYNLAAMGAKRVLVLERDQIGSGTTSQSSGILRTHYSVVENIELAQQSWAIFKNFAEHLHDEDASAGLVNCGYLIAAPEGPKLSPLSEALAAQLARGIEVIKLSQQEATERLPICRFDDAALIGFEPEAGFADAYLVASSYARVARRLGVKFMEGENVTRLLLEQHKVVGVETKRGVFHAPVVISTQSIWSQELTQWTGIEVPLLPERHKVIALEGPEAYTYSMPVYKDLGSPGMLYCRSYGGRQMLVSEGTAGEALSWPDNNQGNISMNDVVNLGEQVSERFPSFAEAGLASSWTGVYDVTPDWNPVLGAVPDVSGLVVGFGFSGHGFKLSPAVGRVLAQQALGLSTDVPLSPYSLERFRTGHFLHGRYGSGAVA